MPAISPQKIKLRSAIKLKNGEARKLVTAAAAETRDMSPDEMTRFNALQADVESIKSAIEKLDSLDESDDEVAEDMVDDIEEPVVEDRSRRRSAVPAIESQSPAIQTSKGAAARSFKILRALRSMTGGHRLDGIEGEVSQEMAKRIGRGPGAGGFFLPLGENPEIRALMNNTRHAEIRADLTTSTGAGAIFTVPELPIIDLLRSKLVVKKLGATILTGLHGNIAIPRQSGSATIYWLGEGSAATATSQTLDQVPLTPLVAIAATNISKMYMEQTSVSAEDFVKNDLAETMAREYDRVCITGSGSNQPLGILQNSAIQTLSAGNQGGANGAVLTYPQLVNMEALVTGYNVEGDDLAYLTNPRQRGVLKTTPKVSGGTPYPIFAWEPGDNGPGTGEINSYPAYATTNVPANLTKGTATTCSGVIFGKWSDLVVGSWDDVVEVLYNPYSQSLAGAVTISMNMVMDAVVRHNQSFQIISDAS